MGHPGAQVTEGKQIEKDSPRRLEIKKEEEWERGGKEKLLAKEMAGWAYWVQGLKRPGHAGISSSPFLLCMNRSSSGVLISLCPLFRG